MNGNRPAEGAFDHPAAIVAQVVWHAVTAPVRWLVASCVALFGARSPRKPTAQRNPAQRRPAARRPPRSAGRRGPRRTHGAVRAARGARSSARTIRQAINTHVYDPGMPLGGPPRKAHKAHNTQPPATRPVAAPRTAPAARPSTTSAGSETTPMPTEKPGMPAGGRATGDAVNYETTEQEIAQIGKEAAAFQAKVESLSGSLQSTIGDDSDTLGALASLQESADQAVNSAKELEGKFRANHENVQEAHLASAGASRAPAFYGS